MDQEKVVDMLYAKMQLETAKMYAGIKEPVLSNDAREARNNDELECQHAENEAANAREIVEEQMDDIEQFESCISEEELLEASELLEAKTILMEKINNAKQSMSEFDTIKAKKTMDQNAALRDRLARLQVKLAQ